MRVALASVALAIASIAAPAAAVTITISPTTQAGLVSISGTGSTCPIYGMGGGCQYYPTYQTYLYDFDIDGGNLNGTFTGFFNGGYGGLAGHWSFSESATVTFSNGKLISSFLNNDVNEDTFDYTRNIYTTSDTISRFTDVAVKINGNIILPLPEASTWAMLITGFGMIGYAMRRRAKVAFA